MFDPIRDKRQEQGYNRWVQGSVVDGTTLPGVGTLIAPTGYGKTTYVEKARRDIKVEEPITVIVPRTPLKEQWEAKNLPNVEVKTIQWVLHNPDFLDEPTLLLAIDEAHLFAAEHFSTIFEKKHKFLMCLTATIERMDGLHTVITDRAPIVDEVPYDVAVKNAWVEDVQELNLYVPMSEAEEQEHHQLTAHIKNLSHKFTAFDYSLGKVYLLTKAGPAAQEFARISKMPVNEVTKLANMWRSQVHKRKSLLFNATTKFNMAMEIHDIVFPKKTIFFGQSIQFADRLHKAIGEGRSVLYHSELQSRELPVIKSKDYKTEAGAKRYLEKYHNDGDTKWKYKTSKGIPQLYYHSMEKFGKTRLKRLYLEWIASQTNDINTLISAKALEVGLDIQDLEYGINTSSNSNPASYYQKRGRVGRVITDEQIINKAKRPFLINLVSSLENGTSQDEVWLTNAQGKNVESVYSIDELKDRLDSDVVNNEDLAG